MELSILHAKPKRSNPNFISFDVFQATNDDVCPISQDAINDSCLHSFETINLIENKTHLKGIKLSCGHKFNGIFLIYHWARNKNVLCPVCRGGVEGAYLNLKKFPKQFNACFLSKIRQERRKDIANQRREHEAMAQRFQQEEDQIFLLHFIAEKVVFVIQPRFQNNSFMILCDAQILSDGTCVIQSHFDQSSLLEMTEFKCFLAIKTNLSQSRFQIQTRLPESAWFTYQGGLDTRIFSCNNSMFCQYTVVLDPLRSKADFFFKTPFFYFKQIAQSHIAATQLTGTA